MTQLTATGRGPWTVFHVPGQHEFVRATGDEFEREDPATGELVATLRASTPADIDAAVEACGGAHAAGRWASDGGLRARVLYGFAQALRADAGRLAELLVREQG